MGKSKFVNDQIVTFVEGHEAHGLECRVIHTQINNHSLISIPGYNGYYWYPNDTLMSWQDYLDNKTGRFYRFTVNILMETFIKYLESSEIRYGIKPGRIADYVFVWDEDEYRAAEIRRGITEEWDGN